MTRTTTAVAVQVARDQLAALPLKTRRKVIWAMREWEAEMGRDDDMTHVELVREVQRLYIGGMAAFIEEHR